MDNSPWAQQFSKHLATLQQPEKEAMLDFVVVVNVLRNKETEVKQVSKGMKWRLSDLNKERRELLKMIMESFFSPNCDTPIALRNQVLRQNLKKILNLLIFYPFFNFEFKNYHRDFLRFCLLLKGWIVPKTATNRLNQWRWSQWGLRPSLVGKVRRQGVEKWPQWGLPQLHCYETQPNSQCCFAFNHMKRRTKCKIHKLLRFWYIQFYTNHSH